MANPKNRLSGDQNGDRPSSVPASRRHSSVSRSWIHRPLCAPTALKTILWPSGETDTYSLTVTLSGSLTWKRMACTGGAGLNHRAQTETPAGMANSAAILGQTHRRFEGGAGAFRAGDSVEIHSKACFTSRADCQRLSGSFSRHVATTRSSAGGESG